MASYDFNRILMGTAANSFSWERFFRELGLAALARKVLGILPSSKPTTMPLSIRSEKVIRDSRRSFMRKDATHASEASVSQATEGLSLS
jgi:hypothetical protein